MTRYAYQTVPPLPAALGLVVLQADETIEGDFRAMLPPDNPLYVSRVPSGDAVTPETLQAMAAHITAAAALLPHGARFDSVGYACTSGTAQIGVDRIAALLRAGIDTTHISEPVSALVAACRALAVRRLAILSPYVAAVSERLRDTLSAQGVETPVFGSFEEAEEARVVRIDGASILSAARDLAGQDVVDAIFLSCTNLRTLDVIDRIEGETGLPCLSSNQVLAWHMAGAAARVPGKLGRG
jgi:maleate isomerase